jgi:hypothetical protein
VVQKIITLMNTPEMVIYSNVSAKKSNLGATAVTLNRHNNIQKSWQVSIGSVKH